MKILVIGGSSSGKSITAQRLVRQLGSSSQTPLVYLATMQPADQEDHVRIGKHIREREGWGFHTIECTRNIGGCAEAVAGASLLTDSTTALLSNEMFFGGQVKQDAHNKIIKEITLLSQYASNIVVVGDNIFEDTGRYDRYSLAFIEGLGKLHRAVAEISDLVLEVAAGQVLIHKGKELAHYAFQAI